MSVLLGIDVGTTATKALLLDPDLGIVAEAERVTHLRSPHSGWAEEDPREWWHNVCSLCRELITPETEVVGVGVTGMVPCTILLDDEGRQLRRSVQQNDARTTEEVPELRRRLSEARVLQRTGSAVTQQSTGPRLLWLASHEPDVWAQTKCIMGSYDFIAMRLSGERAVESNWALESGLFDLETGHWAEDIVEAAGGRLSLLPPVASPDQVVGQVTADAAGETGLPVGIPVVAGCADHIGSAFASGLLDDGDLLVKLGGAGDILLIVDEPLVDDRLFLDFHLVPGLFVSNGCMATSGSLIRWFQEQLADGLSLSTLDEQADAAGPGAGGVVALPYFLGEKTPINDPTASGAFVGLRLTHTRGHLFRAVLEGIAYGFRHHLDVFRELGHAPRRVRVTDGGSRSAVWTQITADVLGLPLEKVAMRSASAVAAAFAAGRGVEAFTDWHEIERFVSVTEVVEPTGSPAYERNYRVYRELYPKLREVLA